jgi:hypothetical protein
MLALDDDELTTLMHLAQPLDPDLRDDFLRAVAGELEQHAERGDGLVHRVAAAAQRKFLSPLSATAGGFHSKYR